MSQPAQVFEVEIKTTPEKIWEAITSPDWSRRYFFESDVRSDFRRGSKIAWQNAGGMTMCDGEILEIDPPWKMVMTWNSRWAPDLAAEPASRVTWEIEERGKSCLLRVTHDRLENSPKTQAAVSMGWQQIVEKLRDGLQAAAA